MTTLAAKLTSPSTYRHSRAIPYNLLQDVIILFEESMYSSALHLLASLLTSDHSTAKLAIPSPPQPAACIPTAQILALVTTLAVHPTLNTRSNDPTLQAASDLAVFYLRDCIRSVGTLDSTIAEAWTFRAERKQAEGAAYTHRRENKRQKIKREEEQRQSDQAVGFADSASISSSEEAQIKSPLSGDGSLFGRVDDFAALLGWALNCSVRHKKRWARYKLLLTIILDAIDQDWRDRSLQSSDDHDTLRQSLLARLICTDGFQSRTPKRRLLRSILADGSHKSIQEFPEVWKGETKPPKKTGLESRIANRDEERKKRKVMDVDAGEFGDYDDPDDEDDLDLHALDGQDDRRRSARRKKSTQQSHAGQNMQLDDPPETTDALEAFGGFDSMIIRKRILVLLTTLSIHLPHHFTPLEDLLDVFTESLRPLPLQVFMALSSHIPGTSDFTPITQACLCQMLLRPLISAAPPPYIERLFTLKNIADWYMPHAASSVGAVDNAKVAGLIETLVRVVCRSMISSESEHDSSTNGQNEVTPEIRSALDHGIEMRKRRAQTSKQKSNERLDEERQASEWMNSCHGRLMKLMDTFPQAAEEL